MKKGQLRMKTPQRNDNQNKGPFAAFLDYILEKISNGFTGIIKYCISCPDNSRINDHNVYNMMTPNERGLHSSTTKLFGGSGFGAMDMESMYMDNDNALKSNQSLSVNSTNFSNTQPTTPIQINDDILRLPNNETEESFISNNSAEETIYSSDNSVDVLSDLDIVEIPPHMTSHKSNTPSFDGSDYIDIDIDIDISDNDADKENKQETSQIASTHFTLSH